MVIEAKSTNATCPRCGQDRVDPTRYSTSRRDNRTRICAQCGTEEAMYDWFTATGTDVPEGVVEREMTFYLHRTRGRI